jgi:hypothetical protein
MGIANVLFKLASKGIKPAVRNVVTKTVLSFKQGEKQLVQMYDQAGNLEKFKIHAHDGIFGGKTITKGTRKVDNVFHETTTTKVKREVSFPNMQPEETTVVNAEIMPGSRNVRITKGGLSNDVTEVTSTRSYDGSHFGEIKRNGYTESFYTSKTSRSPLDSYGYGLGNEVDNYGLPKTDFLNDYNYGLDNTLSQQNRLDNDMFGVLGLGMLDGII